jgi:adenine deaminase
MKIKGRLVDILRREIYTAEIHVENGRISTIKRTESDIKENILPGLIDAHIHIESSMVTPGAFAAAAVSRGTTSVVSDPHEIANVLGIEGVKYMMRDGEKVPLKFWFGAPSCVPATSFESAGEKIGSQEIEELLRLKEIKYLAEMMNFPGVIHNDSEVYRKIEIAKKYGKVIDGHAPLLSGEQLKKYIMAGITTDHECSTLEEAMEKIDLGMKILIREGSAARNLDSLKELIKISPDMVMLCTDDLHPEMLAKGHMDKIIEKLISDGFNLFDVIRCCTLNPARHYDLEAGLLKPGDPADLIIVDDFHSMNVLETWIDGTRVFDRGKVLFGYNGSDLINKFNSSEIGIDDIIVKRSGDKIRVIKAFNGELFTKELIIDTKKGSCLNADIKSDILKIIVKDRYRNSPPAVGFINGFGIERGALASSVAHDSHNIICIGTNDKDMVRAVNQVVRMKGGLAVSDGRSVYSLPLPVAGIMSDQPVTKVATEYENLSEKVRSLGCRLSSPFMTLSFMALLVIPELKMSDRGLFDGRSFGPVSLFVV